MYYLLIIFFIIIILSVTVKETYKNFNSNYSNDIYAIRPPYAMARKYDPNKLGPFRILKNNFLAYPMEGYQNNTETFLSDVLRNTGLENGINKMRGEPDTPKYPPMSEDEKHIRDMMNILETNKKDNQNVNMRPQKMGSLEPEKKDYQKEMQEYKFFNTDSCGDGYKPTGAYISSTNISCNAQEIQETKQCRAIARIEDGKLVKINIIECGSGYKNPIIEIIANDNGSGAEAKITSIGEGGSIKFIEVINEGRGYEVAPTVIIKNVGNNNRCYLCKKM